MNIKLKTAAALLALAASGTVHACGSEPYLGEVCTFASNFCPRGYAPADGTLLSIAQNTALFSLLGTTYGGNGQTTFALPDLRGRSVVSVGQPQGLSPVNLGEQRGSESATLTAANLPASNVNVTLNALQANGTQKIPSAGSLLAITNTGDRSSTTQMPTYAPTGTGGTQVALGGVSATLAGGNQPVSTLSPQLGMTVCIATEGIFPSRP
ncbi:phage tail protein [Azotobacter salinestris]|uniref:phage tail protein n=1 Tax=Azotobacter salinestris TaxID=69964 RepID=UPI0032DEC9E8